jgi:hypothetical protein
MPDRVYTASKDHVNTLRERRFIADLNHQISLDPPSPPRGIDPVHRT